MAARFSVARSSVVRHVLLRNQQIRAISQKSSLSSPLSSLISHLIPPSSILPHSTPPINKLTIPAAACLFSSPSFAFRTYSSHSELPSNVILVKSDDQLKDSLQKEEDGSSQAIFYFTAAWCGPCQFLWPDMRDLSEDLPDVKFYKIDIDEVGAGPTISNLSIYSVPTLHFFKNGKKAAEVVGADVKRIRVISSELYRE